MYPRLHFYILSSSALISIPCIRFQNPLGQSSGLVGIINGMRLAGGPFGIVLVGSHTRLGLAGTVPSGVLRRGLWCVVMTSVVWCGVLRRGLWCIIMLLADVLGSASASISCAVRWRHFLNRSGSIVLVPLFVLGAVVSFGGP